LIKKVKYYDFWGRSTMHLLLLGHRWKGRIITDVPLTCPMTLTMREKIHREKYIPFSKSPPPQKQNTEKEIKTKKHKKKANTYISALSLCNGRTFAGRWDPRSSITSARQIHRIFTLLRLTSSADSIFFVSPISQ